MSTKLAADPQDHGYTYSDNNPLTYTDPTGLMGTAPRATAGDNDHEVVTNLGKSYSQDPSSPQNSGWSNPHRNQSTNGDDIPTTRSGSSNSQETYSAGLTAGARKQLSDYASSLDPRVIYKNVKALIQHPPSLFSFVESMVKGLTHYDDFIGLIKAYDSGDSYHAGFFTGKLLVEVSGDILIAIVGGEAANALKDAEVGEGASKALFRTPAKGNEAKELAGGLSRPDVEPGIGGGGANKIYVGSEGAARSLAEPNMGYYADGYIRYDMHPAYYDDLYARHYHDYAEGGTGEFEIGVPYDELQAFNHYTLKRTWIPYAK